MPADDRDPEPGEFLGHVFQELEDELEAGLRWEAEQEAAAALRAEAGDTALWQHLSRRAGSRVVVRVASLRLDGVLLASYPDFLAVKTDDGREHLVPLGAGLSVGVAAGRPSLLPRAEGELARRYGLGLALRELARRREPVLVTLADDSTVTGTVEVVGLDYVEVAEHELGEARRRAAVSAHRFVPLAALAAVSLLPGPPGARGPS